VDRGRGARGQRGSRRLLEAADIGWAMEFGAAGGARDGCSSEKYCDSMGVLEIFKPPEGFCPNLYFLGVWKCLFRGFVFEICQIGVLIF